MSTSAIDLNDAKRFSITFLDISNAAVDPSIITASIKEPDGVVAAYTYATDAELVKDSTGNYHVDYTFTKTGRHRVTMAGTGNATNSETVDVWVRATV